MIEVQIFIPATDNDGNAFTPNYDAVFLELVAAEFNGCSMLPAVVTGVWHDDAGRSYTDNSRILIVLVDGLIANGERVRQLVELAKEHYEQLAIYVRYLGEAEII